MASSTSILVHNNKILFILRDDKPEIPEPNTWQLPGGGVEEGEDFLQAIRRELQEEISVIPQQLILLGSAPGGETKVFFSFLTDKEVANIALGNEGQSLQFFTIEEALHTNLTKKLFFYISTFKEGITELIGTGSIGDVSNIGLSAQ